MSIINKHLRVKLKISNEEENHSNQDRYLITYADLITLLLGLFVILYASAQIDEAKYKEFSKAFSEYFRPKVQVVEGGDGVLEGNKNGIPEPILPTANEKTLEEVETEAKKALASFIDKGMLNFNITSEGMVLTLPEKLLFEIGKADLQFDGLVVLDTLADVIKGIPFQITIDGHTDNTPIRTFRYESNWHLSVARALSVGYNLIQKGVNENNLSIRGFGSQRPETENNSAEGRAKNRRVSITISQLANNAPSTKGYAKIDSIKSLN